MKISEMFTITRVEKNCSFIKFAEFGFIKKNPEIHICKVNFEEGYYTDIMFNRYCIPLPELISQSVVSRRAEYLAGRYAAQKLLSEAGCNNFVTTNNDRSPAWPLGWSGSISHSYGQAIAIVCHHSSGLLLGVDIEKFNSKIMIETAEVFTNKFERCLLSSCDLEYEIALMITFSGKESLYKALYPYVRKFMGFEEATILSLDKNQQKFTLQLNKSISKSYIKGQVFSGCYMMENDFIITLIAL